MKNKCGRKKIENPRVIEIRFRVNEDENAKIEALAKKYQMNKSKFIRSTLLHHKVEVLHDFSKAADLAVMVSIIKKVFSFVRS